MTNEPKDIQIYVRLEMEPIDALVEILDIMRYIQRKGVTCDWEAVQ